MAIEVALLAYIHCIVNAGKPATFLFGVYGTSQVSVRNSAGETTFMATYLADEMYISASSAIKIMTCDMSQVIILVAVEAFQDIAFAQCVATKQCSASIAASTIIGDLHQSAACSGTP